MARKTKDSAIDARIIEMRKEKCRILTIHNWLIKWENFEALDEQITLAHILNVLDKAQIAVSRKEVKTCFMKHYNKNFHGEKKSYLMWLYNEFNVKSGTIVDLIDEDYLIENNSNIESYRLKVG